MERTLMEVMEGLDLPENYSPLTNLVTTETLDGCFPKIDSTH